MVIVKVKIPHPYFTSRTYWYAQECADGWYILVDDNRQRTLLPPNQLELLGAISPFTKIVGGV